MQMQTFHPQEIANSNSERIHVPGTPAALGIPGNPPPSLIAVFAREAWRRKRMLAVWGTITVA